MKTKSYSVFLVAAGIGCLTAASPAAAQGFLTGKFTSDQESHSVSSSATGTAVLEYFDGELFFFITVEGLSGPITGAHFHNAPAGVDGGVVRDITASFEGNTAAGVWTSFDTQALTDELVAELFGGNIYINIHTSANPAGEIRAQLTPTDGVTLTADLTPEQESHDVTSDGRGTAIVQISESGAAFFVTVDGLTGPISAAHFHNAAAGVDGGVVRDISADFNRGTATGFWTPGDAQPLSDEFLVEALKGNLYLNVHTAAHPAGELRGQLLLTSGWGLQASLDPSQEVGGSTGTGFGTAALTLTVGGLVYDLTVTDLTGPITGAHIHNGTTGTNGPVVHPFTEEFDGNTASGIWGFDDEGGLTPELLTDLLNGELYLNVHTTANPAGELRGQILRATSTAMAASLTPEQETAVVTQAAAGTAFLSVSSDRVDYELTVDGLSGPITGAHFHNAALGADGGVVKDIVASFSGTHAAGSWTAADGTQPLTDELRTALLQGQLYLNIHTSANPGGEVRGQIFLSAGTAIRTQLTSEQETAEVTQGATGTGAAILTEAGLIAQLTVENLSGPVTAAHYHNAGLGQDGPVVRNILGGFVGSTAAGFWPSGNTTLSPELRDALLSGDLYLNIHTSANQGGELRGQTRLANGIGSGAQLSAEQETGIVTSDGSGTAALNLSAEGVTFDITVDGLTGDITGAHFHNAPLGTDGGVVRDITNAFQGNTAFGVWRESDGQPFTTSLLTEYVLGNTYLNIHTAANPAGEIRGQVGVGEMVATAIEKIDDQMPQSFELSQNYPNPFNPSTTIEFDLALSSAVDLTVYNAVGQLVQTLIDNQLSAGSYRVSFDAQRLPSGVYTYRLTTDAGTQVRKMLLVK